MKQIQIEEVSHFTCGRITFIATCFVVLFGAQHLIKGKNPTIEANMPSWGK